MIHIDYYNSKYRNFWAVQEEISSQYLLLGTYLMEEHYF